MSDHLPLATSAAREQLTGAILSWYEAANRVVGCALTAMAAEVLAAYPRAVRLRVTDDTTDDGAEVLRVVAVVTATGELLLDTEDLDSDSDRHWWVQDLEGAVLEPLIRCETSGRLAGGPKDIDLITGTIHDAPTEAE